MSLLLSRSWSSRNAPSGASLSPSKAGAGGGRLQLHAAPLSAALSSELMTLLGTLQNDMRGTQPPEGIMQPPQHAAAVPAADYKHGVADGLQGKASLEGLRLLLLETASWERQQEGVGQQQPTSTPAAAGWRPSLGSAAVAVTVEEAVVLLQQAPLAENRPWLTGSQAMAGAMLTSADASLIGAAIAVWHAGKWPAHAG